MEFQHGCQIHWTRHELASLSFSLSLSLSVMIVRLGTRRYLRCLYPNDTLGAQATSFSFIGHRFFENGLAVAGLPAQDLDARLASAGAVRTCSVSAGND